MSYIRPAVKVAGSVPDVPKGQYRVYCRKAELATSKSEEKNPMVKCELEIHAPDTVTYNGVECRTAGRQGTMYLSFSEKNLANMVSLFPALGIELPPPADSMKADIDGMRAALAAALPGLSWLHSLESKRQEMLDADGKPILDNSGSPIYGRDRLDFPQFNILPNTFARVDNGQPY